MSGQRDPNIDAFDKLIYGKTVAEMGTFLPGTSSRRFRKPSPEAVRLPYIEQEGTEYAEVYQKEDLKQALETSETIEAFRRCRVTGAGMSLLEDDTTICTEMLAAGHDSLQSKVATYSEFDFSQPPGRKPLAIDSQKENILKVLKSENVLVIKGFTGCGKTTQVPQFILDECAASKTPCNIVVTQPRRIAAMSIAKRVCNERNWTLGTVVGFQVGMMRQLSAHTLLTYMTTGCLLEALVAKKSLDGYTHIILDEVHERDEDTDLLLMVVRKFMRVTPYPVKVILMSATADASKFAEYFKSPVEGIFRNAPVIDVESNDQRHPVRVYHLDDLKVLPFLNMYVPGIPVTAEEREPKVDKLCYSAAVRLIAALDEKREINRYGRNDDYRAISNCRGAVLVFLPGMAEIEEMNKALLEYEEAAEERLKNYWMILPLHSRITSEEQNRVFDPVPQNSKHCRKIILSTNIAESSLTVPDIIYVIDFCLIKQLQADPETNFCCLRTEWAPRNNCIQRQGRVGRVNEGVVYRMVWKTFYNNHLPEDITPEILRCPLESAVLRTKLLDLGPPKALLGLVIDPPKLDSIVRTVATLKEVGALFTTAKSVLTADDGDLSYLGRIVARLPVDVHLGKLIMLGYIFNILEECVIMAAGMGSKNIFTSPFDKKLLAYNVKMSWAEGSFSDPITLLNAYQVWKSHNRAEYFKRSGQTEKMREKVWARENYIQLKALKDMDDLVTELNRRLASLGIESPKGPNIRPLSDSQKGLLLRVVLFGAFYPNYFSRDAISGQIDEREAVKSLCGADPYSTVQLRNFPSDQPPKAYVKQIKGHLTEIFKMLFNDTWNVKINFDSQRVFLTFHQEGNPAQKDKIPGRICLPVYLAVKQKQLRRPYSIKLMRLEAAERYSHRVEESARQFLMDSNETSSVASGRSGRTEVPYMLQMPQQRLPTLTDKIITVSVCHVEEPSHFWCHQLDHVSKQEYNHITTIIGEKGRNLQPWDLRGPMPVKGNLVMAPFCIEGTSPEFYRAKVLSVETTHDIPDKEKRVRVYFIDYGNAAQARVRELRIMKDELLCFPPLAIECRLTGVGPSPYRDLKGGWVGEAKQWFEAHALDKELYAKVFSVVGGVTSMDLVPAEKPPADPSAPRVPKVINWKDSFANQLLSLDYAVKVEESYCSKADNQDRQEAQLGVSDTKAASKAAKTISDQWKKKELDNQRTCAAELMVMETRVPEPDFRHQDYNETRQLIGPYSPLEMKMYGKVHSLLGFGVKIEDDSVNSVLLDDQPGDSHERVLAAGQVGTKMDRKSVIVRSTTLLPNIPGLPAILTLLFAPRAEFRADDDRKCLTGAICGLGYDKERSQSFYPEHDMEIGFDAEIGLTDVLHINKLRFWLNSVLGASSYSDHISAPAVERMREVSTKSIQLLFDLVKTRKDVKPVTTVHHRWNQVKPEHVLPAGDPETQRESLIPLHDCIKLIP